MPFFVADVYSEDLGALPNFDGLVAAPNVIGCILKATQGTTYLPNWFLANWPRAQAAGRIRYGTSWFRGAYHFADPYSSGAAQADFFLGAVERAGGWGDGDMPPFYDLEGAAWTSSQQIIDIASSFAERVKQRIGKTPCLYTGATVRDRGITSRMGFRGIWTPHLDMTRAGWNLGDYKLWQYAGDGKLYDPASARYGFPTYIPGWGGTDMSVVMAGGSFASSLGAARDVLIGGTPWGTYLLLGGMAALLYALA